MVGRTDEADLVRRTLAGEASAFAELVERYRDAVCGLAYHHLGSFEEAQDAAQEAFVSAYLHLKQLREPKKFSPWLRRITANVCVGLLRRRGDRILSLEELPEPASRVSSPERDLERAAARLVVREALSRLSERSRLTVTLFYINGYSQGEIADFLEVPVNTVRSRLQRAKRRLREEMVTMVSDMLNEGKPGPEFTRQAVEEAIRRGEEAHEAHATSDALRHYDEALSALEQLATDGEQRRLRMDALWKKGAASEFAPGWPEAVKLYEQALAIAEELGDRARQASMLQHIGVSYSNMGQKEEAEEYYHRALEVYEELGSKCGQGSCLWWLCSQRTFAKEAAAGKPYCERALALFKASNSHDWAAVCRAMLDLLAEIGEEKFSTLLFWSACCSVLERRAGAVRLVSQPGSGLHGKPDHAPALSIGSPFWQISHLRTFLDPSVPVGGSWSGNSFSYGYRPLKTTVTVKSASTRVTVPAGEFGNCLLIEQVTKENGLPDDTPEHQKSLNRRILCGTGQTWFAPGVGIARLHVQNGEGTEAVIELKGFSLQGKSEDYLPLAVGNSWTYGWANVPPEYVAKESYRVAANEGDLWYLEEYSYVYKQPEIQEGATE